MLTKTVIEYFKQVDDGNTVVPMEHKQIVSNSASIFIEGDGEKIEDFYITGGFIILQNAVPVGVTLRIEYKIEVDEVETSIEIKVKKLEKQVEELKEAVRLLDQALLERVDKHSFRVWIKAVEMKMGISVIDANPHGIDGINYHEKNN
jgi:hypothetical protein